jgi:DNA-binding FadR family transcriptional regulator
LEKKGLVEIIPRKGAFVRTVTTKDIKEKLTAPLILVGGVRSLQLDSFSRFKPSVTEAYPNSRR